jgi:hypothetical protein
MSSNTRHLSSITRIYRNVSNEILGLDEISVVLNKEQISIERFIKGIDSITVQRTLIHLSVAGDRVIAAIQMIGDYSSIQENDGNFLVAIWDKKSDQENDLEVSLEPYVSVLGDEI